LGRARGRCAAAARPGRHHAPRRRVGQRDQQGRVFDESSLPGAGLAIGELTFDAAEHGGGDTRGVVIAGRGRGMEEGFPPDRKAVDAIEKQDVKVGLTSSAELKRWTTVTAPV